MNSTPPCVVHEDEHLLVVAKPAGWNTHAPDEHAGEGIFEWLRDREPRWAALAIMHRLDRDTSGLMVFALSVEARRSLTQQFAEHEVQKRYLLITAGNAPSAPFTAEALLSRRGERYFAGEEGDRAVTRFAPAAMPAGLPPGLRAVYAEPVTGRTHQIRVQAAQHGFPVLGDALYGGAPVARLHLHAAHLAFRHPATNEHVQFERAADFLADASLDRRAALIMPGETTAYRLLHGAADRCPGARIDRLGEWLLHQSEVPPTAQELARLESCAARGVYHRTLSRQVRKLEVEEASPRLVSGEEAPARFTVRENGLDFELSFEEGYSTGLFLDQRDNRRRLITAHVAAGFDVPELAGGALLNVFAYTCAFSVCAARVGAATTSLDLSKKYLDWGRRNFVANGLDPATHDFIYGDAFDWLRRLGKKGRRFDVIILDPPTFSQSKAQGVFRAESDYGRLVAAALPVLAPGGVLLACSNAARLAPAGFLDAIASAADAAGRRIEQQHYAPQPPDFPISRDEPAHLKSVWLRIR